MSHVKPQTRLALVASVGLGLGWLLGLATAVLVLLAFVPI